MFRVFLRICRILVLLLITGWAITALILNHTEDLNLHQYHLSHPWFVKHYDLQQVETEQVYRLGDQLIAEVDEHLFVNGAPVLKLERPLVGAIEMEHILVLATNDALILLSQKGEFIEKLGAEAGIPAQIQNIGLHYSDPVLQTRNGMWRSNFILDRWELISLYGVSWSQKVSMPTQTRKALQSYLYGEGVPMPQFLSDINTGRIMGVYGHWLNDLMILLLLILAIQSIFGISGKSA